MAPEPVSKVRCPACKSIVPVYTNERPTPIECPTCGKKGMIR
jgi:ribosomal protein S27E